MSDEAFPRIVMWIVAGVFGLVVCGTVIVRVADHQRDQLILECLKHRPASDCKLLKEDK